MSSTSAINAVPLFDGSNYNDWSSGMKAYLQVQKLFGHASGTKVRPSPTATNQDAVDTWDENDGAAIGAISLRLPNHIRQTVIKATARETWQQIETTYGTPGAAGLFGIFREAIGFEIAENSDPAMPIATLTSIFGRLDASGLTLSEPVKAMLPSSPRFRMNTNRRRSNATSLASRLSTVNKKRKSKNSWSKQKKQKPNAEASGSNQQTSSSGGNSGNNDKGNQKKKWKGKGKAHANEASTDNPLPVANFASFSSSADPLKDVDPYTGKLDPLLRDMKIEEQELPPDWAQSVVDDGFARIDDYDEEMYGSGDERTSYWQIFYYK
ncbi:hypothetical protein BT96DRAFT_1027548 [Gymnopus androsaceus JB14]|uniref:DUF4219 domain-containing protein n=1 Tax=Gymnopus androsaceus JB14 TaxID=1447944 RepID=A0A6A4GB20_9AGAR|nr:hypothetical protein BT96DRAFT_1027548 [Gymnopus androsaceus JB14]